MSCALLAQLESTGIHHLCVCVENTDVPEPPIATIKTVAFSLLPSLYRPLRVRYFFVLGKNQQVWPEVKSRWL